MAVARGAQHWLPLSVAGRAVVQRGPAHAAHRPPPGGRVLRGSRRRRPPALYRYTDYWGTAVTSFDLHAPHTELKVVASSVVGHGRRGRSRSRDATWRDLTADDVLDRYARVPGTDRVHAEGPRADRDGKRSAQGRRPGRRRAGGRPLGARAADLPAGQHGRAQFGQRRVAGEGGRVPGLRARHAGVCCAPWESRPATSPATCTPSRTPPWARRCSGESHAWVEAWTGGWWAYDPTNDIPVGQRHVWVAIGRDYADVTPLKGIYSGAGSSALDVTVDVTRLT